MLHKSLIIPKFFLAIAFLFTAHAEVDLKKTKLIIDAFGKNINVKSQKENMANMIAGDMGMAGFGDAICKTILFDNKPDLKLVSQKFPIGGGRVDTYLVTQTANCFGEAGSSSLGSRTVSAIIKVRSDMKEITPGEVEPIDFENLDANCILSSDDIKVNNVYGETEPRQDELSNPPRGEIPDKSEFNNSSSSEGSVPTSQQ